MKTKKILLAILCLSFFAWHCTKENASGFSTSTPSVGQGGSLARFTIAGDYLYSVDENQLKTFDISTPDAPVLKNTQDVGFEIETIYPFKDKLFIGSTTQVHIFSIENPAAPQKLSSAISPTVLRRCDPVVAKDTVAYATLRSSGPCGGWQSVLAVYNIKDISNPVEVTTFPVNEPYGLGYADDVLYVCDRGRGLLVFDISDAYLPKLLPVYLTDGDYVDVIPFGNTLICWVTNGIILYDITDNRNPQFITRLQ